MKPNKTLLLFAAFALLLFTNMKCKKQSPDPGPETLPAETQSGARTFGCLVDGKVWLPISKFPYSSLSTTIQYDILGLNSSRRDEFISIAVRNMTDVGNYDLKLNNSHASYIIAGTFYECKQGLLTITRYDRTNKILSGRFSFIGQDSISKKTVSVTDGRFDVTFTN